MNRTILQQAIDTISYYASVCGEDEQYTPAKQTIEALRTELAKPEPVAYMTICGNERWQPIETAPLGGTEIILYGDAFWPTGISPEQCHLYGVVTSGYHSGGIWQMCNRIGKPTHWMPLPNAYKQVGYMAHIDGKPCWDADDVVCVDAVWPAGPDDDRVSVPIFTREAEK